MASGSLRVRVYAGTDVVSGGKLYLKETVPVGPDALERAERVRDELIRTVEGGMHPRTDATVAQLMARYLERWRGSVSYAKAMDSYVRLHVVPLIGEIVAHRLDQDDLDDFRHRARPLPSALRMSAVSAAPDQQGASL